MISRVMALLIALILVQTAAPTVALAQTDHSGQPTININAQDWQGLSDLKPGRKILVEFKPGVGEPVEGKFISAIGGKLTLSKDGDPISLERRDIQRVYRLKGRWTREKAASIGTGIGMAAGAMIGAAIVVFKETRTAAAGYGGVFIGMFAGMGLGALLGGKRRGQLLYEAQ